MSIMKLEFNNLVFVESSHTYFVKGKKLPSVSSQVEKFYEPFDKGVSKWVARSKGVTQAEILAEWKKTNEDAILLGNNTHNFAERYLAGECIRPKNRSELGVIKFLLDLDPKYTIEYLELKMYNEKYGYAGTTDLLIKNNETGKYIIADWKTNKDLHKNYSKKMYPPFSEYVSCPLSKYKIQLNLYKMCVEQKVEVEDMWIIWLDRSDTLYQLFEVEDLSDRLENYYATNR